MLNFLLTGELKQVCGYLKSTDWKMEGRTIEAYEALAIKERYLYQGSSYMKIHERPRNG